MKTPFLFSLLFCLVTAVGHSQFTQVPDPNFENFLESNGMGDGIANNGQVLTANIENVTGLGPVGIGIQDLTGIEDFAALEILDCSVNPISSLDVSQNTQLTALACWSNAISNLVIGNQPNLTYLDAHENFISQLDLTLCPNLETVYLEINSLSSLDVTQCPNIELLYIYYNNLNALDISQNVAITSFKVSHNNIDSLDASQNSNLVGFLVSYNPFTFLDVRNGANEGIAAFVARETPFLDCIYVDDASATYLEDWVKDEEVNFAEDEAGCLLAIEDQSNVSLWAMYPNPVATKLTIRTPAAGSYQVHDVLGKRFLEGMYQQGESSIEMSFLPSGLYFLSLTGDSGSLVRRIVKK